MMYLEQLPDHERLEHRSDAPRCHHEGIGGQHELMQPREERTVLESVSDEGVDFLLEGKVDADAKRSATPPGARRALVRCLHQPGPTAGDDVAAELGERRCHAPGLLVAERSRLHTRGSEDAHTISFPPRWPQTREVVDHVPESQDRRRDDVSDAILVLQAHRSLAIPKFLLHTALLGIKNPPRERRRLTAG